MNDNLRNQELLTIDLTAKILSVNKETLRRWDRNGKLKAVRIGERRHVGDRRYRKLDIIDYLAKINSAEHKKAK